MPAYAQLLVILAAMIGFWAIVMRPARNQQKKVHQLQQGLQVGERVILTSGIFGTVRALNESRVELEVAPGTVLTVARQAVVRRADELGTEPGDAAHREGTDQDTAGEPKAED